MRKKILFVQFTNPAGYPPLIHSARILARKGWKVNMIGADTASLKNFKFDQEPDLRVDLLPADLFSLNQKLRYVIFCLCVVWAAFWLRPSFVYVSDAVSCPAAWLLTRFMRFRLLYHEHDYSHLDKGTIKGKGCRWARKKIWMKSDIVIFPNEDRFKRTFLSDHPIAVPADIRFVWNCPELNEVGPERLPFHGHVLHLIYHGSIVPKRFPLEIIDALTAFKERIVVHLFGYETVGFPGYRQKVLDRADLLGVRHLVEISRPICSRSEFVQRISKYDVGLSFMPIAGGDLNEQTMAGASNKPFEYLACGMPVLVSNLNEWKEMFVSAGCGFSCDPANVQSIAEAFQWFLDRPKELREMGERGRRHILKDWNYEHQFEPVIQKMNAILEEQT